MLVCIFSSILFYCAIVFVFCKIFVKLTSGRCDTSECLIGKTAIITGGNKGIGFETALGLATRGCKVIVADITDGTESISKIKKLSNNTNIIFKHLDLSSFESIRKFSEEITSSEKKLDILVNNAGIPGATTEVTKDGLNKGLQVNHFGPFLLTILLLDLLKKSSPSRIIFVSSLLAYFKTIPIKNPLKQPNIAEENCYQVYNTSKLFNLVVTKLLAEKLKSCNVSVYAVHPGLVNTQIFDGLSWNFPIFKILFKIFVIFGSKTPREGAQTSLHLATSEDIEEHSGKLFSDCKPFFYKHPKLNNDDFCKNVWELSEQYVGLAENEKIKS